MKNLYKLLINTLIITTFGFGQPKILNESFNNFNGAFKTQPKIPHSIQKQHNLITENQLTSNSSSIFWVEPRIREDYQPPEIQSVERKIGEWCGTMPWWESRNNGQRSCDLYGATDDPTIRDSYIPDANTDIKYVRLFIHAFADDNGDNPSSTLANAEAQLFTLNEAFSDYKIQFVAWFQIHNDSQYQTITSADWSAGAFKALYAEDPTTYHNIYVMDTDASWSILGVSTFPWDSEAITNYGGTIIDEDWFGGPRTFNGTADIPNHTITHELGHALGLWHTHHGVDEVTECGSCYEGADGYTYATGDSADVVGDLCSDTKATPTNFACLDPTGTDCQGNSWVDTDVHNFMGYADDDCYDLSNDGFSSQQSGRVFGWISDKYEGLVVSSEEMTLLSASFEDGTPADWTIVDNDADGNNWFVSVESAGFDLAHYGISGMVVLYNASGNDDWLITPVITVPQDAQSAALKFWARSYSSSFLEDFNVKLSTTGNSVNDFTVTLGSATDVSSSWTEYSYDISAYAGESIYLALQCVSVNEWYLFADDFLISASLNPLPLDAEYNASVTSGYAPLSVAFTDLSTGNPTSWDWDFGDGNSSTEQNPTHIFDNYGLYTVTLTVSDGSVSSMEAKTDYITVSSPPAETILSESFETELPSDWTVIDNDADGNQWLRYSDDAHDGSVSMGVQYNSSGNDDWLITPQLTLTENSSVSFSFWARSLSASWLEDFNVLLSTSGNSISDFTTTLESMTSTPYNWTEYSYDLSAYSGQTIYLAVQCVSVDQLYLFVDEFELSTDPMYTFVPDDNFEQALIDLGYDDVLNDSVLTTNISGVTSLDVSNKDISDLTGIESFTALNLLNCDNNELTSLDLTSNTILTYLYCRENQLVNLDVDNISTLNQLHCHDNQLTSLDLTSNTALTFLTCQNNQLTSLDLSSNTALTLLYCGDNQLTSLNVNGLTALTLLSCDSNQLTSLDVSGNTALTTLDCHSNQLTSLDVSTNIALTYLNCSGNPLGSLDVSTNTALTNLNCSGNQLTSLDVSGAIALEHLRCYDNQLTSLDVSANTALTYLDCNDNQLTSLDVSANTALTYLDCNNNQLTSLDVSLNTALTALFCDSNQLDNLDVSANTALIHLQCNDNQLTSLDVSNNIALEIMHCWGNQLTSLDVSKNTVLTWLHIKNNQLTYLNMKNGLTDQLSTFNATGNSSLTCIETLDPDYATANWTSANGNIDAGVTFDVICGAEAQTNWYVATTGSDASGSGTEASPLATIQTAINATTNGDTVSVAAGTYVENINYNGKNIAVIGADSSNTIVDGDSSGSVVTFENGEDETALLSGFTIQNGNGTSHSQENYDTNTRKYGGGIFIREFSKPVIKNIIIKDNFAYHGAGVAILESAPIFVNCSIQENQTSNGGTCGGMLGVHLSSWQLGDDYLLVQNSKITNNFSESGGSGVHLHQAGNNTVFKNTVISGNQSTWGVGGISHMSSSSILDHCTITDNHTNNSQNSGGIHASNYGNATLKGTIVTLNSPFDVLIGTVEPHADTLFVEYSMISGGMDSITVLGDGLIIWSEGNIDVDPMFVDSDNGNYHLLASSMLINAGHLDSTDSDGSRADIGAYPYLNSFSGPIWYVQTDGSDTDGTGSSSSPFASIQSAINFATTDGDSVNVAAGTYVENVNFRGRNIKVVGSDSSNTIIDGNQSGSVVTFINEEDSTALLRNFTVTNGTGSLFDNSIMGGGILIGSSTHPKIENILITGNSAADGGGIYIFHNSTPILSNLTITNNVAVSGGGGITFQVCSPILINSTISNNTAGDGGGIRGHSSNVIIDNVSIIGNSSAANGGGLIFDDGSNPTLTDVNISSNTASGNGGGMYLNQSNPTQTNVTISGNTCENNGGGFFMKNNSNPSFSNSILWNDLPQEIYMEGSGGGEPNNATIDHTDIQGGQDSIVTNDNGTIIWASGNIDVDPHFVDPENGDYHLADWSPCIATGLDTSIVSSTDIEGNPRPNPAGSNPDLGAYENALGAPVEHIVIVSDTLLVSEDSSATVDFRENDLVLNAIALFLSIIDSSSHGSIILTGDTMLTYTPAADFFGYDTVQYALSGTTAADTGFVFITVVNEDDMPVVVNAIPDITVNEDAPDSLLADLDVVFMDIDDELEYSHVIVDTTLVFASVTNDSVTLQFLPDANGSTVIIFTATNPTIRASVSDTLTVILLPVNDAPLMSVITDTTVDEETELEILLTASDVDGDVLTFSATADTSAVIVAVSTDTLSVSLVDNWNGSSILMVVVSDGSATDTTSFELTVNAVNDAPSSFALNEQDSVYIAMANFDSDSIVFTWDESADVDEDELTYHFTAELVINGQLTTEYDTTLSNNEMLIDYQSVFDEIYAAQAMLAAIEWDVSVSDGVEEVLAENGPLTVGINASDAVLSIDEELLPDVYALHQNYPNPFNPITTLRYDLPEQSMVNIIIYDLLGRHVRTLLNQTQDAGYRSVIWNATNDYGKPVSAGVYLYKIQAGEFVQTKKMVLLK